MAEPLVFQLGNETQWDGVTEVTLTRNDFDTNQRHYKATAPNGGAIKGDFFGLLSPTTSKLVSVAANTLDPRVRASVTPEFFPDRERGRVDLTPVYQSMLMSSTDVLRIISLDGDVGTREITIIVNELSEAEAVRVASQLRPETRMLRHRITRGDELGFTMAVDSPLLASSFSYNLSLDYLTATTTGQGYVSIKELTHPTSGGAYVWVRFTGLGAGSGEVYLVDPRSNDHKSVQAGLQSPLWSEPIWLAREDRLAFRSDAPMAGKQAAIEFEVLPRANRQV